MRRTLLLVVTIFAGALGCAPAGAPQSLGTLGSGKSDAPALLTEKVELPPRVSESEPSTRSFDLTAAGAFRAQLSYPGEAETRLSAVRSDDGTEHHSERASQPSVTVPAQPGGWRIQVENWSADAVTATLTVSADDGAVPSELLDAARANLHRVSKEIDTSHLFNYRLFGELEDRFLSALKLEYATQHPDQYAARLRALGSMVFFALPDVQPPASGHLTPFHGLDEQQFQAIMDLEDRVFQQHISDNGGRTAGVRPFSVCETRFLIETYVRPRFAYPGYAAYKAAYEAYAATCPQKDLDEWYNFRGLGGLRPSWVEANLNDRFLRRMAKTCTSSPAPEWKDACDRWNADRMAYRIAGTRQLAARTLFYDPSQEAYLTNPSNSLVLLEDRNGDGVGEFLRPGPITLASGETGTLQINSTGQFSGNLKFVDAGGATRTITPKDLVAEDAINAAYDPSLLATPDFGLLRLFSDGSNCTSDALEPSSCPLLRRFYSMIDRHENFYQTYSALSPDYYGISSQPSPLVACSITLAAAHVWDTAGTPSGGSAGFIFLMRIPFKEILAGSDVSVGTLSPGPQVTSIQSLYRGENKLDMSRVWLDVATLSNNLYASEHEISAFGAVPADEIEGILVIRKPAAVQ